MDSVGELEEGARLHLRDRFLMLLMLLRFRDSAGVAQPQSTGDGIARDDEAAKESAGSNAHDMLKALSKFECLKFGVCFAANYGLFSSNFGNQTRRIRRLFAYSSSLMFIVQFFSMIMILLIIFRKCARCPLFVLMVISVLSSILLLVLVVFGLILVLECVGE